MRVAVLETNSRFKDTRMNVVRELSKMEVLIQKRKEAGFDIIDIGAAEGYWVALFAKNTAYSDLQYALYDNWGTLAPAIAKRWKEGYRITDLAEGRE